MLLAVSMGGSLPASYWYRKSTRKPCSNSGV